nr:MAG TPA: hypothetical protein [Caudoviricetes sp.]
MRVEDFIKLYYGCVRVEVEIYAIVTVFNEKHRVLVRNFDIDCTKAYTTEKENYLSEEVIGFEIISDKLRIFIMGV